MDPSLLTALQRAGGIARRRELLHRGVAESEIRRAWADTSLLRVRNGVYALPSVRPEILRAVRLGGALAGASATACHGLWTPPWSSLYVSVPPSASSLRDPDDAGLRLDRNRADIVVLYDGHRLDERRERFLVLPRTCLLQSIRLSNPPVALAILDSGIRTFRLGVADLESLRRDLPRRCRKVIDAASGSAESGTESAMRWGLLEANLKFEPQVWLTDTIRVDFVVAGFIAVECVSYEHHSSPSAYQSDRERISRIARLGYVVLEFTYHQVMSDWPTVLATILASVLRG